MNKETHTHTIEHRTAMTPAESVIKHIRFQLSMLQELADHYKLKADAVVTLRKHLLDEIKALEALPPETPPHVVDPINEEGRFVRREEFSNLLEKVKKS